jgi:ADP-L-glycero-D-manno-heptose 6-epimerase
MYIVVTGAAGFIGANLVKAFNGRNTARILAVDDYNTIEKTRNVNDCQVADWLDKKTFPDQLASGAWDGQIAAILHEGACSDTLEVNPEYMLDNNYRYSVRLFEYCQEKRIPFLYASSASVYGSGRIFREAREFEAPLNVYGYSKFLFDQYVRAREASLQAQVVGLRYFNVYGPREAHKGRMASVAFHFFNQYREARKIRLFEGCDGYAHGMQRRDFISVEDAIKANLYFYEHPDISGIFNVGTGKSQTFNDVAQATINALRAVNGEAALNVKDLEAAGQIEYIPLPEALKGKYQSYTQADVSKLRAAGYHEPFLTVEQGVERYIKALLAADAA